MYRVNVWIKKSLPPPPSFICLLLLLTGTSASHRALTLPPLLNWILMPPTIITPPPQPPVLWCIPSPPAFLRCKMIVVFLSYGSIIVIVTLVHWQLHHLLCRRLASTGAAASCSQVHPTASCSPTKVDCCIVVAQEYYCYCHCRVKDLHTHKEPMAFWASPESSWRDKLTSRI